MKLIENWKESYKLWSVQLSSVLVILSIVQTVLDQYQISFAGSKWFSIATGTVGALILIARVVKQNLDQAVDEEAK